MLASQWYFFKNISMSISVWNFAFNELFDLKNLKKLISGSCPTTIIQSYINKFIYIWTWSTQDALWFAYFFVNSFWIYNYLLFFKSDHIWFQHHFIHVCPSQFFSHYFQILKTVKNKLGWTHMSKMMQKSDLVTFEK